MQASKQIPNLAGLCTVNEAARSGLTVDENVNGLKRIHFIKKRLYNTMVQHMNRTPEWEVKGALSLHIWLDSEHVALLRKRVSEMREPPLHMDAVPDKRLEEMMDELLHAESTVELLTGFHVIRTALLEAYRSHQSLTNPLVDQPTCRMIKLLLMEEAEMLQWLEQALEALLQAGENPKQQHEAWKAHIVAFLVHTGGILGREAVPDSDKRPTARGTEPYVLELHPRRDNRFTDIYNSVLSADDLYLDVEREPKERVWALFYKRLRELDVPEMQCSIVAQTMNKPWEYYRDMGRQIWDEARHSMMGEVAFIQNEVDWTKLPIRINFAFELNTLLTAEERHAILYEIEFGLMPGDVGKRYEWEISKETGYELAINFHDYDWADEVLHAQIGKRWIVEQLGGVKQTLALAKAAREKLDALRPDYVSEDSDWWQHFYNQVKDKPFL